MIARHFRTLVYCTTISTVAVLAALAFCDYSRKESLPQSVTCYANPVAVKAGEPVQVTMESRFSPGAGVTYSWQSTGGKIEGRGPVVMIHTDDLAIGTYTVMCMATDSRGLSTAGNATFSVSSLGEPTHKVAVRNLLLSGKQEELGYGLYGYLLRPEKPQDPAEIDRWTAIVKTVVETFQADTTAPQAAATRTPSTPLSPGTIEERKKLSLLLIPVRIPPPTPASAQSAAWIVENYDYRRAERLLSLFQGKHEISNGPYLVACLLPLSYQRAAPAKPLWYDMTPIPTDVALSSLHIYKQESAQPRYWDKRQVGRFTVVVVSLISETVEYKGWAQKNSGAARSLAAAFSSH